MCETSRRSFYGIHGYSMSRQVDIFRLAVPAPLTKRDFTLIIPNELSVSALFTVQAFTFPTEERVGVKVVRRGQEVELPGKFKVGGDWTFSIPENSFAVYRPMILSVMYSKVLFDVYQIPGNIIDVVNPSNVLGSFTSLVEAGSSVVAAAQTLNDCWIRSVSVPEFGSSSPETPIVWDVTIHYNSITKLIPI